MNIVTKIEDTSKKDSLTNIAGLFIMCTQVLPKDFQSHSEKTLPSYLKSRVFFISFPINFSISLAVQTCVG